MGLGVPFQLNLYPYKCNREAIVSIKNKIFFWSRSLAIHAFPGSALERKRFVRSHAAR